MLVRNRDLRRMKGNIPFWAIAERLGVHENTVYRLFRSDLSEGKKQEILRAIDEIKKDCKAN